MWKNLKHRSTRQRLFNNGNKVITNFKIQ